MPKPKQKGLYLARSQDSTWWPYIVEVIGEEPYLKAKVIANRGSNPANIDVYGNDWLYYKIEEPDAKSL